MQECGTPGMELLSTALRDQRASFMDHLDLIFKWISLRLCEKENVKAMGQVCRLVGTPRCHIVYVSVATINILNGFFAYDPKCPTTHQNMV